MKLPGPVYLIPVMFLFITGSHAASPAVEGLLQQYRQQGAGPFSAARGEMLWRKKHPAGDKGDPRGCTTCHGLALTSTGKHVRTGKPIKPMAPSANPARLSDERKISKWLRRNCKWTLGRQCNSQEKGDLLMYLINQ